MKKYIIPILILISVIFDAVRDAMMSEIYEFRWIGVLPCEYWSKAQWIWHVAKWISMFSLWIYLLIELYHEVKKYKFAIIYLLFFILFCNIAWNITYNLIN